MKAWHFIRDDRLEQFGESSQLIEAGYTYYVDPPLKLCKWGLHASVRAIDALKYAPGVMVCKVELGGEVLRGDDKLCAIERTVIWMADATKTLHLFGLWCAEQALARVENPDPRSIKALEVKRAWLKGEATDKELARAAWDAGVMGASGAAAWASDAARAAATAATARAATARAATTAATALRAAWAEEETKQNEKLTRMLNRLEPKP